MLQGGHRWNNTWEALGAYKHARTSGVVSIAPQSDELGPSTLVLEKTHAQQSPLDPDLLKEIRSSVVLDT